MNSATTIDLSAILAPHPEQVKIIEAVEPLGDIKSGDLVLLNTARPPTPGNVVLCNESLTVYEPGMAASAVAYCIIHFLS